MTLGRHIIFDPAKEKVNLEKHGLSLTLLRDILIGEAITRRDFRLDYGETRFITYGYVGGRLHVAVWAQRGDILRSISIRKANAREQKRYG